MNDGNGFKAALLIGAVVVIRCAGAFGGDGVLHPLSPETIRQMGQGPLFDAVKFSHDSAWLMAPDAKVIRIWDVATRRQLSSIGAHAEAVTALDVATHRGLVATGDVTGTVYLWQLPGEMGPDEEAALLAKLPHPDRGPGEIRQVNSTDMVLHIAIHPNRSLLAAAYLDPSAVGGAKIVLWDCLRRQKMRELKVGTRVYRMVFVSEGMHLLAALDATRRGRKLSTYFIDVQMWDTAKFEPLLRKPQRFQDAWLCQFSTDGSLAATLSKPRVDQPASPSALVVSPLRGGKSLFLGVIPALSSFGVVFSPDGRLLASGSNESQCSVKLWSLHAGGTVAHHELPRRKNVNDLAASPAVAVDAFAPDGRFVAVSLFDITNEPPNRTHFLWQLPENGSHESSITR